MHSELLDVLAEDGSSTGTVKSKEAIHRDGDWHLVVHVWLFDRFGILLQRRSALKENFPNFWDASFAGHVDHGESIYDAAIREAREELDLVIHSDDLEVLGRNRSQHVLRGGAYIDNEFQTVLVLRHPVEVSSLRPDTAEVADIRSVPISTFLEWVSARNAELVPNWTEYQMILDWHQSNGQLGRADS